MKRISYIRSKYHSHSEFLKEIVEGPWSDKLVKLVNDSLAELDRERTKHEAKLDENTKVFWDIYTPDAEPVVKKLWEWEEMSLPRLESEIIRLLTLEWVEKHAKTDRQNDNGLHLPKDLDTERARQYFPEAIRRKYMERTADGKYHWIGTGDRGPKSQLAYFLGQVYNYIDSVSGNAGESFPEKSLDELFREKDLYKSLRQAYTAGRKQRWRTLIDEMFEQG